MRRLVSQDALWKAGRVTADCRRADGGALLGAWLLVFLLLAALTAGPELAHLPAAAHAVLAAGRAL